MTADAHIRMASQALASLAIRDGITTAGGPCTICGKDTIPGSKKRKIYIRTTGHCLKCVADILLRQAGTA